MVRTWIAVNVVVMAGLLAGCGGSHLVPVSGKVTLDGQPLGDVTVTFQPQASGTGTEAGTGSFGATDTGGTFALRSSLDDQPGATVGRHRVTFASRGEVASDAGGVAEKIPARYRTEGLEFDVPAGGTDRANFELSSR